MKLKIILVNLGALALVGMFVLIIYLYPFYRFFFTVTPVELDKNLKEKGIKTVIVVGTSAEGAVLNTASGAAQRGLKVIIPVDGMSSNNPYAEQYTAWHLANAPRIGAQTTLTKFDLIGF